MGSPLGMMGIGGMGGMRGMNPMRSPFASIGGMVGGRQGAAIGGLAGMLLPAIQNIFGSIKESSSSAEMQSNNIPKVKTDNINQAAIKKEIDQEAPKPQEAPKKENTNEQTDQYNVTQTVTDTKDKPDWIGDFRAGLKHTYLDFDGKMIYI
jgi:hypothetical protein